MADWIKRAPGIIRISFLAACLAIAPLLANAADNDALFKDQAGSPLSFNPRLKDLGGGLRMTILGIGDPTGVQIAPMQQTGGSVTALSSPLNPTSVLTRRTNNPTDTTQYAAGQLIGSNSAAGSVLVPFFTIPNGQAVINRLRLETNATGWAGVLVSVNLWTATPTYTNGDGGTYAPATGALKWIINAQFQLFSFGDGSVGGAQLTGSNGLLLKLPAGTSVFWDIQIMSVATPIANQTFTLTAEALN